MKLYSENDSYKLYQGNMLDMLEVIEKESIDSIVTDPPYELNFMSKGWDNAGISFQPDTWRKCYEVLKPGGYLLAFGGSRTFHRIAVAIEDAGFEIRDTIMWLYGSGFPKSMNIGLAIDKKKGIESKVIGKAIGNINQMPDGRPSRSQIAWESKQKEYEIKEAQNKWKGWGTALKPSFEPIIVARKPFKGSLVDNIIEYGVGGINIDECRVEFSNNEPDNRIGTDALRKSNDIYWGTYKNNKEIQMYKNNGRFPANTILTYDETDFDEVCGGFPITHTHSMGNKETAKSTGMFGVGIVSDNMWRINDSGSASRYFYCAKASKKDRDEGLDEFEEKENTITYGDGFNSSTKLVTQQQIETGEVGNRSLRKNTHPTVKPTNLMQYLIRLVTPNGGTILDPFNGSGSTGKAVMYENKERNKNYKYIGIELTEEYLPIAKARIEYVCNLEEEKDNQTNIFEFIGSDK